MRVLPRLKSPELLTWPEIVWAPAVTLMMFLIGWIPLSPLFISATGIAVQLPPAVTAEVVGTAGVVITITDDRRIYVNGELADMEGLEKNLSPLIRQQPSVLIKADRKASMEVLGQVWDVCRKAGASKISMATSRALE